jgi:hypothetical protein
MPYVQRNETGLIVGIYENMQPGVAEEFQETAEIEQPIVVPQSVTMRQARLALLNAGLLDDVEAAINALPEPPRRAARIEWEFSSEVFRNRDFVLMLGQALGLDAAVIDALFIEAATL